MTDREIVARVRGYTQCLEREHFAEAVPTGMALTSTRLIDYAAVLRELLAAVERLEREWDSALASCDALDHKHNTARADVERLERERDEVTRVAKELAEECNNRHKECSRLTAENERLREDGGDLYLIGRWECARLDADTQARLWEALRDALGIEKGTATALTAAMRPTGGTDAE